MSGWKLVQLRKVTGQIEVVTGLRIGANQETMEIGGLDNPIMRDPVTGMPYLPGSSLKGKMRSLAEWHFNEIPDRGDPTRARSGARTADVFGVSAQRDQEIGPTRLIVRDAPLAKESEEAFKAGQPMTEVKHENSINRLTAMANPRPMERVVPGVRFDFELVFKIIDNGDGGQKDRGNFDEVVLAALSLLETDYLGSAGSRGCGQVRFVNLKDESGNTIALPKLGVTKRVAG
ncbi:MAG TPA: type III-A CRISPR-associated RAMP protein Csm3 [Phycisphaerae bacterium]|nr:type III-A CRISPR-associated RAMP protein Csm3 [Phycisphaerae bacterium]